MTRRFQMTASLIILVIITWLVSACNNTPEPPQVSAISADPGTDIMIGESASLTVKASGQDLQFKWNAARGKLSSDTTPSVIYEAPDSPGPDTVTVNVVGSGGASVIQSITFQVVAPTSTPTPSFTPSLIPTFTPSPAEISMPPTSTSTLTPSPIPTNTPAVESTTKTPTPESVTNTPMPEPPPISCGPATNPGCLKYVSPQLAEINSVIPFVFPEESDHFTVEYTNEAVHTEPISIKIGFEAVNPNFGGWGIGGFPGYDVSGFERVCFYLKGTVIGQTFEFKVKDLDGVEDTVRVTVDSLDWTKKCFDLNENNFPNVNLTSLENINLGFNDGLGSATIYVDDFVFETSSPTPTACAQITSPIGLRGDVTTPDNIPHFSRAVKVSWAPDNCVMIVQFLQGQTVIYQPTAPVQSGTIDMMNIPLGWTEIKIWVPGDTSGLPADNMHVILCDPAEDAQCRTN